MTQKKQTQDLLLSRVFEPGRWLTAIGKGVDKDIRRDQLLQLTKASVRAGLYLTVKEGRYAVSPPHAALIPKDKPGEFRRVFVNEPADRVLLSIINDVLFETCADMIHPACKSYLKETGCGKVVRHAVEAAVGVPGEETGWKADLSKYFDSVPIEYIDDTFNRVERTCGPSAILELLRKYYHCDLYFNEEGELTKGYQSLKQGCAVAAFLADAVLSDTDTALSSLNGFYVRYSDDMLYIGEDKDDAMLLLKRELEAKRMTLNPKKVEPVRKDRWFTFLGYAIRGKDISISRKNLKTFEKEIRSRTVDAAKKDLTPTEAVNNVNRYLYKGNGRYSWATHVLPICNIKEDIDTLNAFVMDCIRAVETGRKDVGGLGFSTTLAKGCIARGKGRNVASNRRDTGRRIEGYLTIGCMRNAFLTSRQAYETLTRTI